MSPVRTAIRIAYDPGDWVRLAAEETARSLAAMSSGPVTLALAGGSTPRPLYRFWRAGGRPAPDWSRTVLLFGDERCVPPGDAASNYRAVERDLLDGLEPPPAAVERIEAERGSHEAAERYERRLEERLGPGGRIDVVLLGVGADGHTASIFPGGPPPAAGRRVAPGRAPAAPRERVTLTLEALAAARQVLLLARGPAKADVVARTVTGGSDPRLPVSLLRSHRGLTWILDREAAAGLPPAPAVRRGAR